MNIQKQMENEMMMELKESGYTQIWLQEFNNSRQLIWEKRYSRPMYAIRKLINYNQGKCFIYQGNEVNSGGNKIRISLD